MYKLVVIFCDISIYKMKHAQVIFRHNKKRLFFAYSWRQILGKTWRLQLRNHSNCVKRINKKTHALQGCIPVGCVPPACWLYPSMHCWGSVPAQGGLPGLGRVPAPGGVPTGGVYLPVGGTCLERVYLPRGVYLPGGYLPRYSPTPCKQNDWQTGVKTNLRKLRLRAVKMKK